MKTFNYKLTVERSHLDAFEHMNNATYMQLFEQARWDFVTKNGFGMDKVKSTGIGSVILEANIKFRKEVKLGDKITILSQPNNLRSKIVTIDQTMLKADETKAAIAQFAIGLFDLKQRKLVEPTKDWLEAIGFE